MSFWGVILCGDDRLVDRRRPYMVGLAQARRLVVVKWGRYFLISTSRSWSGPSASCTATSLAASFSPGCSRWAASHFHPGGAHPYEPLGVFSVMTIAGSFHLVHHPSAWLGRKIGESHPA